MLLEHTRIALPSHAASRAIAEPPWFALWTNSHCEERVREQLDGKGFRTFLPTVPDWSRRAGVRRVVQRPMFSSYLFVQHDIDKRSYVATLVVTRR